MNRDVVLAALYSALDEINENRAGSDRLPRDEQTLLRGTDSTMTSIEVVNFIVAAEFRLEEELGTAIELADDPGLWQDPSPFASIGSLATYISDYADKTSAA